MSTITLEQSVDILASPESVWRAITDWERLGDWMKEGSGFKVTSISREGIGVTATARIRVGLITTYDPIRITKWDKPHLLEMEHLGWVKGTGIMQILPIEGGSRLSWWEMLSPPWGPFGALGMRLYKPLMHRTFVADLANLKSLLEGSRRIE